MMDERQDPEPPVVRADRLGKGAHGQTIDDDACVIGELGQRLREAGTSARVHVRKVAVEVVDDHPPPEPSQPGHHARVVDVAAGPLVERAGHDDVELGRGHRYGAIFEMTSWTPGRTSGVIFLFSSRQLLTVFQQRLCSCAFGCPDAQPSTISQKLALIRRDHTSPS